MLNNLQNKFSKYASSGNLKRYLFVLLLPLIVFNVNGQTKERKWNVGVSGGFNIYAGDLGNSITDFTYDVFRQNPTFGLDFSRYLNKSFDLSLMGSLGSFGYYYPKSNTVFKGTMAHGNLNLRYKFNNGYLLAEDSRLSPYIFAGYGASQFTGSKINNNMDYPVVGGAGLNLRFTEAISFFYQFTYGYMSTAHNNPEVVPYVAPTGNDQFFLNMFGLRFNLGAGKDEDKDGIADKKDLCANTPANTKVDANGCPLDSDKDGVVDSEDHCPDIFGSTLTFGCPDMDKDGIADKDDQCPNEPGVLEFNGCPDTDGDGIIDSKDKCPNVKGILALDGCPDSDGDGIKDEDDMCPNVFGVILFKGCPDTDGDGIEDSKDMCPTLKGPASTNGCPDTDNDGVNDGIDKCPKLAGSPAHSGCPDTDADGIFDDIDRCITIPGTMANDGCPEIKLETKKLFEKALQGIQFETGKDVIKPVSFPILDAIVKVMKDNPSYKLVIDGHTDDVGEDAMNLTLSENRAASVVKYLIGRGVNPMRLTSNGYGESKPVDTNLTDKGRTRNRRVEFKVEFMQ
ncbi:MAG: OmpA family protein [bacterium]|nr:OmpA family protein [bacterium]